MARPSSPSMARENLKPVWYKCCHLVMVLEIVNICGFLRLQLDTDAAFRKRLTPSRQDYIKQGFSSSKSYYTTTYKKNNNKKGGFNLGKGRRKGEENRERKKISFKNGENVHLLKKKTFKNHKLDIRSEWNIQ